MKKRITGNRAQRRGRAVLGNVDAENKTINAHVCGQLAPHAEVARVKVEKRDDR